MGLGGAKFFWEEPEHQGGVKPDAPQDRKLSDQEQFDRTPLVEGLIKNLYGDLGRQTAQAGARASKFGAGRSSGLVGQTEALAAGTEDRANQARQQAALDTFKEALQQKQFGEQMDQQRYQTAMNEYLRQETMKEAEKADRRNRLGIFSNFFA